MNRDLSYLLDVEKFGTDILTFVAGMDESSFATDIKTQNAVLYGITIIGEAVKQLSAEIREQNPQIPWKQISGMRDKCVHDYRQINIQRVWRVTQTDIPELLQNIKLLLRVEDDRESPQL
ncbi:DUF86 domain-containing protein [Roseofilum sp. BLCC_M91]|uniref:DUF86 domain-containing protein n=1 Tax=Roseofilum halophilum BLCC-M91 TaxID=3022259 RepID=A0ABT7BPK4_9CYAN|nr:DUF86 domain-containing protein [Roseofilum halophilum]MDJ1181126.1 DUF86 domain-containing protein [Roseofilum halophilum BLCC-M91]